MGATKILPRFAWIGLLIAISSLPIRPVRAQADSGATALIGKIKITNPSVIEYLTDEDTISLNDLTAFIKRDRHLAQTFRSPVVAAISGDVSVGGSYIMTLPIAPRAILNDVGRTGGAGVQIFSVDYTLNFFGDIFPDPYESGGWQTSNTSVIADPGTGEITGGRIVVWSPDDQQAFPTGFGADEMLFTDDDPAESIPSGWSVIDLNTQPFTVIRDREAEVDLSEGSTGTTDFSTLGYVEAFDALIADLRLRYALSEFKGIDYDALIAEFRPQVETAERSQDREDYKQILFELAARFRDGHVSSSVPNAVYRALLGSVGLSLAETDDGVIIAQKVSGSAARAGIEPGAEIVSWNSKPTAESLDGVRLPSNYSSDRIRRLDQVTFLARVPVGSRVQIEFRNPGQSQTQVARLTAVEDYDGLVAILPFAGGQSIDMPISARILPSGIGYIAITTFSEKPQLLVQTWEWALNSFGQRQVSGLIIDLRKNSGGFGIIPTYFAGAFFDEPFVLYNQYRAQRNGDFMLINSRTVRPTPIRWYAPVAVLIGPYCASACEIFAAALAQSPNTVIVGRYPTFGIAAGLFGPWKMPGGVTFSAPVLQPRTPDGNIFLENVGVEPTVKVPVTVESLLSSEDLELAAAEDAVRTLVAR